MMTKNEIQNQAAEIRADLKDADDSTYAIIIAELHSLDKLARAQNFTVMFAMTSNGFAGR